MKRTVFVAGTLFLITFSGLGTEIIAQWDFNSVAGDNDPSTGSVMPSFGSGVAQLVGGITAVFASGSTSDSVGTDNSAWSTTSYPAQGTSNKTAGVQFRVSTLGYSNIVLAWDQKVSGSASKYLRLQYSPDGQSLYEYPQPVVSTLASSGGSVFQSESKSLESIPSINDNPDLVFRIVSEFESTALGAGKESYVTTYGTNTYSRSGTIRLDMVTIVGERIANANTTPFLSLIPRATTILNQPTQPIAIRVRDLETLPENLFLSAVSANPTLVPNSPANIIFGGGGSNRTVILVPVVGKTGVAPIKVTLSDGTNVASSVFPLLVTPSTAVILDDSFSYPDGPLIANSAYLWNHRSGVSGQCEVMNGRLQIAATQTEDVLAPLLGGPYGTGSNVVLYASFKATFLSLPKLTPGYFAHFADANVLRARIFASVTNALPGCFKLLLSNGSDSTVLLPWNLHTNATYTLVTRYEVDPARASLWIEPAAESETCVIATDPQNPVAISSYGFRQDAQVGSTILIDDLRVGLSFAAVGSREEPHALSIEAGRGMVVLRWANAGCVLQASFSPLGPFTNVTDAPSPYTNLISGSEKFFRLVPTPLRVRTLLVR